MKIKTIRKRPDLDKVRAIVQRIKNPCVHLGEKTGEKAGGKACGSCDVHTCAALGKCTVAKRFDGFACCAECPRYEATEKKTADVQAHRAIFARYAQEARKQAPAFKEGNGIVIAAGGAVYFVCAYICLTILRRLGCTLPVEVWYLGKEELDPTMRGLLGSLGACCINANAVIETMPEKPRMMKGWTLKAFSILHSRFRQVLFLDADQIPARDPTYLFDMPEFQAAGAVLWPDLRNNPGLDITADGFYAFGLPKPETQQGRARPTEYRPVESGQILVDKLRVWGELWLALKLAEHEDFLYPEGGKPWHCYGDKSTFLAAWLMLADHPWDYLGALPFAMPQACTWKGTNKAGAFLQHDFAGQVVFSHRVQPFGVKWRIDGVNQRCEIVNEDMAFEALMNLRLKWRRPWDWRDQDTRDNEVACELIGRDWEMDGKTLRFLPDGDIEGGGHWTVRHTPEPILVLSDGNKATAFLGREPGGWYGKGKALRLASPRAWTFRDAFDRLAFSDVVNANEYQLPEVMTGWRVVDVGAHIGAFAHACLTRGAHVLCFEPDPENVVLLRQHVKATVIPAAAWRSDRSAGLVPFERWDNHTGAGTVIQGGAARVLAVPLDDFIEGTVDLLKLDCEGSEYPILFTSKKLGLVRRIVGEWHTLREVGEHAQTGHAFTVGALLAHLEGQGFVTRWEETAKGLGHFWAVRDSQKEHPPVR